MALLDQPPPNPFARSILNRPSDYRADWDVPSIGGRPASELRRAIEAMDRSAVVDPERRIHVLLGPPGYGKTHLFGRLGHDLGKDVLFVFVPPIQDVQRPLAHIRHHVVMSLFDEPANGRSPLAQTLASLCRPSFARYVSSFRSPLDELYGELLARLNADDGAVWEIIDSVKSLAPFQRVGESLRAQHKDLDGAVLGALALGWSPEREIACRWLRGESIADELARRLGLPDDPPDPIDVLKAVAVLNAGRAPVILCIDQLDVLLSDKQTAPLQFSNAMMNLRSEVPNLLIVIGCLKVEWLTLADHFSMAFRDRTVTHDLELLTGAEAIELVGRRLRSWTARPADRAEWWPFDKGAIERWIATKQQLLVPRALIKSFEAFYQNWADHGDLDRLVPVGDGPDLDPVSEFRREWDKELDAIQNDEKRALKNVQDQRLARAVHEGLNILSRSFGNGLIAPIQVSTDAVVQVKGKPDPYRYSLRLTLEPGKEPRSIILALEANHNVQKFRFYFDAVVEQLAGKTIGAVLITSKSQVPAGAETRNQMEAEVRKNRLRVISLEDYREDYARLECFRSLLEKAEGHNLALGGTTIDGQRCRELASQSGVLANLTLFDRILEGWIEMPASAATVPAAVPAPGEPFTSGGMSARNAEPTPAAGEPQRKHSDTGAPPAIDDPSAEERLTWASEAQDIVTQRLTELNARVRSADSVQIGPTFARFLVTPYPATTIVKIRNRAEDLKVALNVEALPLVSSQAGAVSIDVQLPERFRRAVRLDEMASPPGPAVAAFPMGQDVTGHIHWLDLADPNACHLLVAGTTGSGKSEFLKAMIAALAGSLGPGRVKFGVVDPKQVTFNFGERTGPFLIRPVANGTDDALSIIKDFFEETERRFAELKKRKLEDLAQWQAADPDAPPRWVLVCDEFADLMAEKTSKAELEAPLKRLGAKARAAGIHLVLATQRPEASVVTPLLRSNLPARICFRVASEADSKLLLKSPDGAELLGRGDFIWQRGAGSIRLQSPYVEREALEGALRFS
jgi:energy-coupling factor transporter ATP-binding protein EcfA2